MGYASVGEVIEVGSAVTGIRVGDIVTVSAPQQEENVVYAADAVILPKEIPAEKGILFTNLITAYNGIMDTMQLYGSAEGLQNTVSSWNSGDGEIRYRKRQD